MTSLMKKIQDLEAPQGATSLTPFIEPFPFSQPTLAPHSLLLLLLHCIVVHPFLSPSSSMVEPLLKLMPMIAPGGIVVHLYCTWSHHIWLWICGCLKKCNDKITFDDNGDWKHKSGPSKSCTQIWVFEVMMGTRGVVRGSLCVDDVVGVVVWSWSHTHRSREDIDAQQC